MRLEGPSALVAGGAGGLGSATVRHLAGLGVAVVAVDPDTERSTALVAELGEKSAARPSSCFRQRPYLFFLVALPKPARVTLEFEARKSGTTRIDVLERGRQLRQRPIPADGLNHADERAAAMGSRLALMIRLLRFALLLVMTVIAVSLVIGIAAKETGPFEKVVLGAVIGLIIAAVPVQRLGSTTVVVIRQHHLHQQATRRCTGTLVP